MESDEKGTYRIIKLNEAELKHIICKHIQEYHKPPIVFPFNQAHVEIPGKKGKYAMIITIFLPETE